MMISLHSITANAPWSSSKFEEPFNDDRRTGKPRTQYVRRVIITGRRAERLTLGAPGSE
jgi:hypothetical protein